MQKGVVFISLMASVADKVTKTLCYFGIDC